MHPLVIIVIIIIVIDLIFYVRVPDEYRMSRKRWYRFLPLGGTIAYIAWRRSR